jgi:CBS domain-containing protein
MLLFLHEAAMDDFRQETVRDNMSRPAKTVAPEMTLGDLARMFSASEIEAYPVVRDEKLVGMVSRTDIIKPFAAIAATNAIYFDSIMGTTVEEIMSRQVIAIEMDATLDQAVHLMGAHDFKSFPVIDQDNRVRGIVTRDDVIRALARSTCRSSLPLDLRPMGYAIA